ncbi:hypothetical protein ACQ4PT_034188 [Festuca glaucescens]
MLALPIPKGTLVRMDRPRRFMFWNASATCSSGDCLVSWETACQLRSEGGLGLIDLGTQNTCLLLKSVYRLLTSEENPWTEWIRCWYLRGDPHPATPLWRCFADLIPLLRSITSVRVGDGTTTSFWMDNWTSAGPLHAALPSAFSHCMDAGAMVAGGTRAGAAALARRDRVSPAAAADFAMLEEALERHRPTPVPDRRALIVCAPTGFKASDAYRLLHSSGCGPPLHEMSWDTFIPVRVKVFIWILRHRRTQTRARLCRLGILRLSDCPFCPGAAEDVGHLFVGCPRLLQIWRCASAVLGVGSHRTVEDLVDAFSDAHAGWPLTLRMTAAALLLWITWKTRNRMVFDGINTTTAKFFASVQDHLGLWLVRAPRRIDCAPLVAWSIRVYGLTDTVRPARRGLNKFEPDQLGSPTPLPQQIQKSIPILTQGSGDLPAPYRGSMSSEPPPAEASEASASPPKVSPGGAGVGGGAAPPGASAHETNTLWVGNLPTHAGEDDVMAAFAPHGALDCALSRAGARSYAFVLFRSIAESRAALEALRGSRVKGSAIRIEFARPARAVRNLWIGGISPTISKQELQEEFQKFGKIEGVAFSRDQTSAYIDFEKLEDAISAHRALNGTDLSGKELCVDFQRSRGRAERSEVGNFNSRGSVPPGEMGVGHVKASAGVRTREADPSNVLWVGFPNTHKLNEEALRRAMAAHGVVTNIKVFPERQYAFVEFATIEGAFKAKNLLDGRLFNDNRIHVVFSNSGLAPSKLDNLTPPAGFPGSDMYSDSPYAAPDYFGPGRATSQGYDPRHGRSGYLDYGAVPVPGGILPAPEHGSSFSTGRSAQNAFDPRDAKRTRMDAGADRYYVRAGSEALHPVRFAHQDGVALAEESLSPVIRIQGTVHKTSSFGHFWRGSIAKGGSPVCRARCLPIKKGIEIPLPDVVNCSARTGLDMLAKHYGDASGFDIVFFLPDSEDDFVSYTEFLRYLGSKSRAGVVKVDSGTTLFLVPPSDFLTNVLQVDGPERLYGVVLHIPQMSTAAVQRPLLTGPESQPYYGERETTFTTQRNYGMVSSNDNHHQDAEYRGSLREEAVQSSLSSFPMNQIAGHQAQSSLKPDIVATLAQLMPNVQSVVPAVGQMGNLQQPGQQASAAHFRSYGGMAGTQEQLTQHTAYNPEMTLNLPPPPPVPTHAPNSAMSSSVGGHSLPTQMNQQQYQPEQYYASQNNYGSVGTVSHSNLQASNTNFPLPPPPQVNNVPLAANNQVGANPNFSSQVQQQQNVASGSSQAPDEADKNKKYQATLQFAHNLLLQLQRGSGNQP